MPRQKAAVPKSLLKAWIPLELRGKLDLQLVSEVEGRVPKGHYSELVESLVRAHLEWGMLDLGLYGFAKGYYVRGPKPMIEALERYFQQTGAANNVQL